MVVWDKTVLHVAFPTQEENGGAMMVSKTGNTKTINLTQVNSLRQNKAQWRNDGCLDKMDLIVALVVFQNCVCTN